MPRRVHGERASPRKYFRGLCELSLIVAVITLSGSLRVYFDGVSALEQGQEAEKEGKVEAALEAYQRSLRAWIPFSPIPHEGLMGLQRIAKARREAGERAGELAVLWRIRGGVRAIESLWRAPFRKESESVDERLAILMAQEELAQAARGRAAPTGGTLAEKIKDHRRLLALRPAPSRLGSLWLLASFGGWILGMIGLMIRGFDQELSLVKPAVYRWGFFTVSSFGAWLLALGMI